MKKRLVVVGAHSAALIACGTLVAACSVFRPPPVKLYDSVLLMPVKADTVLVVPTDLGKDFINTARVRAEASQRSELASRSDLAPVPECGPRTLRVTQELTGIAMGQNTVANRSFMGGSVTMDSAQAASITVALRIEDCSTGKLIYGRESSESGANPAQVLQDVVGYNMYLVDYYKNKQ